LLEAPGGAPSADAGALAGSGNPYASIVEELPAEQPAAANPYAELARALPLDPEEERQRIARRGAWVAATDRRNPDQQAAALRVSHDTGAEPDFVLRNLDEAVRRHEASRTDWNELARNNPELAKTAVDPHRGPLVRDDLRNLNALEWAVSGAPTVDGYQAPVLVEGFKKTLAQQRLELEDARVQLGLDPAWTQVLYPFSKSNPTAQDLADRQLADKLMAAKDLHEREIATSTVGRSLAYSWSGIGRMAPYVLLAPFKLASAVMFGLSSYGSTMQEMNKVEGPGGEKPTEFQKNVLAVPAAVATGTAYSYGFGPVAKALFGPVISRVGGNAASKALISETLGRQVRRMLVTTTQHAVLGAATMAATGALEDLAVQTAEMGVGARAGMDTGRLEDRFVESFTTGLRDMAVLSVGPTRARLRAALRERRS
jgi:hypothetical protein